uniref:Putative molecular chaperone n=1 Tax=Lutzomyia longipalpis TaxID=7200 RepID=A0A1B0CQR3_LUTLO
MSAVDEIIAFKKNPDEDFYALLNCDEHSSVEQIQAEYKVLALQYHPDKNSGDKEAEAKFQQLKEAKEILCDPEKRANYDKWRHSGISISYKNWVGMKEHVHQVSVGEMFCKNVRDFFCCSEGIQCIGPHPKTKDRMLPDGASASSGLSAGAPNPAHRRASEGGAALYYGSRKQEWGSENPSEEAKEILCDPEKRANYDKWRHSGISISYKNWVGMKEHVHQSMHWSTPKTKDRMLPDGASASSGLSAGAPNPAHRRASEGGAALYYGSRKQEWGSENPSEVVNKFRNYEI